MKTEHFSALTGFLALVLAIAIFKVACNKDNSLSVTIQLKKNNVALNNVAIHLYKKSDNVLSGSVKTDDNGNGIFDNVEKGVYDYQFLYEDSVYNKTLNVFGNSAIIDTLVIGPPHKAVLIVAEDSLKRDSVSTAVKAENNPPVKLIKKSVQSEYVTVFFETKGKQVFEFSIDGQFIAIISELRESIGAYNITELPNGGLRVPVRIKKGHHSYSLEGGTSDFRFSKNFEVKRSGQVIQFPAFHHSTPW